MGDRWRFGVLGAVLCVAVSGQAHALAVTDLPATCQSTIAGMQNDKARFAALGKAMTQARKSQNTQAFCMSARQIVVIIKGQSDQLDQCAGEMTAANLPQAATNQILGLKSVYKQMLDAAKVEKNDRFHCGLADQ